MHRDYQNTYISLLRKEGLVLTVTKWNTPIPSLDNAKMTGGEYGTAEIARSKVAEAKANEQAFNKLKKMSKPRIFVHSVNASGRPETCLGSIVGYPNYVILTFTSSPMTG